MHVVPICEQIPFSTDPSRCVDGRISCCCSLLCLTFRDNQVPTLSIAVFECLTNVVGISGISNVDLSENVAGVHLTVSGFASLDGLDVESVHTATVFVHLY